MSLRLASSRLAAARFMSANQVFIPLTKPPVLLSLLPSPSISLSLSLPSPVPSLVIVLGLFITFPFPFIDDVFALALLFFPSSFLDFFEDVEVGRGTVLGHSMASSC